MSTDRIILGLSIFGIIAGFAGSIFIGYRNNYIKFLGTAHWISLILLILAGIATWVAMVWMVHPSEFKVTKKQYVSLAASILISILWWARYAYTVADTAEEAEEAEVKN